MSGVWSTFPYNEPSSYFASAEKDPIRGKHIQGWAKKWSPGLVNFIPAVAYHFYLNLPAAFSQPGNVNLTHPCMYLLSVSPLSYHSSRRSSSTYKLLEDGCKRERERVVSPSHYFVQSRCREVVPSKPNLRLKNTLGGRNLFTSDLPPSSLPETTIALQQTRPF